MTTTQEVVIFRSKNLSDIVKNMNNWLQYNPECKFSSITNVDTDPIWAVIAITECSGNYSKHLNMKNKNYDL